MEICERYLTFIIRNKQFSFSCKKKIYLVHAKPDDYFVRVDGGKYDREHYYQSPQSYTSLFCDKVKSIRFEISAAFLLIIIFFSNQKVAPYLTLFLNGTGWSPSFPRLMTSEQLQTTLTRAKNYGGFRFTNIGDISCDVGVRLLSLHSKPNHSLNLTRPTGWPRIPPPFNDSYPADRRRQSYRK